MNEDKKSFLLSYRAALLDERAALEEYERMQLALLLPQSPRLGGIGGGGGLADQSHYLAMLQEYAEHDVIPKTRRKLETKIRIVRAIDRLASANERMVLRARYLRLQQTGYEREHQLEGTRLMTWDEVAEVCGYSRPAVTKMHGSALLHLII